MVSGSDFDPFYNGFTELWTQWAFDDAFVLTIGQQKHRFTHDRTVSSRYISAFERNMLTNMFFLDYTPAVTLSGRTEKLTYYTGIFSNATGRDMWDAFTDLDSGYSLLGSVTFNLESMFGSDTAHWNMGYIYSDAKDNATNLRRFNNGFSSALILTKGPASLVSEALFGIGNANGDAAGISIQPGYFITDRLELSTRYQLAGSDGENGLRAQARYEIPAGLTTGELYQAGYAGFNYYIAGHRIKWMNGLEYANMDGQDVWTAMTAVRVFWGPHSSGPFPAAQTLKAR